MLFAIDLLVRHPGEDFIDEESVAASLVLSFQSSSVEAAEFYAPQANCFATDSDASFSK
jgi:hypothetical protein